MTEPFDSIFLIATDGAVDGSPANSNEQRMVIFWNEPVNARFAQLQALKCFCLGKWLMEEVMCGKAR